MIAKTFTLLMVLGAAFAQLDLANVDPNTLSCDPLGQEHLLLPHFTECDKFYMCAHGNEVEFKCATGTIFDFLLQTCNHAWATQCWLRSNEAVEEDEDIEGSGEQSGDLEWVNSESLPEAEPLGALAQVTGTVRVRRPVNTAEEVPEIPQSHFAVTLDCSDSRDAGRMMPFNGDCQRFWRCSEGLPISAYCSDGLFFNEKSQQCDFEANVSCNVNHEEELQGEFMIFE